MTFNKITDTILNGIIKELNKKETQEKIQRDIIEPIICNITEKYYPHIMTLIIVLVFVVVVLIVLLILAILQSCKKTDKFYSSC